MAVYRFKVYFEDDESVMREIEIKSSQTFEEFHTIIQTCTGFDNAHPTSFYVSNGNWRKGKEIILLHKHHANGLKGTWMHETKLAQYVEDPHQRFIYEFDPDGGNWILLVELVKIIPDASVTYPRINKSVGTAPQQYKQTTPIVPVETGDEDEEEAVIDDREDKYIHPETEQQYEVPEEVGMSVHSSLVKEASVEAPDEEALEELTGDIEEEEEETEEEDTEL